MRLDQSHTFAASTVVDRPAQLRNCFLKLTICFCLLLSSVRTVQVNAQIPQVKPQQVIPPSPDAASLGKYGSIPVGLATGVPQIEVPIYTINEGSLELPISLSYHASGIKVNEIASWVGLGWALNAGGVISRSIVGKSDEHGFFETTVKSATEITQGDWEFLHPFVGGTGDYESDYYFYNFNGHSGTFIFEQNNHVTPFLIPKEPIKVVNDGSSFTIVDEWGTTYRFASTEIMWINADEHDVTSSYYLTSVTSADGKDVITLTYTQDPSYVDGGTTYTEVVGGTCPGSSPTGYHDWNTLTFSRTIYPLHLSEITFSTGKVKFVEASRTDLVPSGFRLAEIQIFAKKTDGTYENEPRKRFVLNNDDYFGSGTGSRLKLTGLEQKDKLGKSNQKYAFSYIESPDLPPRGSNAQDWWGYYNGKGSNGSLIQSGLIGFNGASFSVGDADRSPNATTMQAGTLKKIVYPTGGYTKFDYEPHYYLGTDYDLVSVEAKCGTFGNTADLLETTTPFTPPTSGWVTVHTYCSNVTDADPFFSRVLLKKQGNFPYVLEHYYTPYQYPSYEPHLNKDFTVYLEGGVTYELKVMSKGHSDSEQFDNAAFSQASLSYVVEGPNASLLAGGLRIHEIRDYESASAAPVTRVYEYGDGDPGHGTLLIPQYGVSNAKQEISVEWFELACGGGTPYQCCPTPSCYAKRLMISGTAALDLTSLNGSPVAYDKVTVYENNGSSPNGRTVHMFNVEVDDFTYADKAYNNGHWQMSKTWMGGDEVWTGSYVGNSTSLTEEHMTGYGIYGTEATIGTKVGFKVQTEGCIPSNQTDDVLFSRLYYFDVPFYTGIKKVISSGARSHSSGEPSKWVEANTRFEYDNLTANHQQLSRKIVLSSTGDNYTTNYWYPADYDPSVDNIQSLLNNHVIATPIKEEIHRDENLVQGKVTRLDNFGHPIELYQYESANAGSAPAHDGTVLFPSGYVKKYDITYDGNFNIASTVPVDNVKTSFLWGYNNTLPVAEITKADPSSAAYTSFEEDGVENAGAKTGSKVWAGVFTLSLPASAGQYDLSYWKRTGAGPWELVTLSVTVSGPNQTVNVGVAGSIIDEVRVMPPGANMTTYTYDPLIGMTSKTDVNNVTSYFRYDASGRLASIVDDKGNTLKTFSYHYKTQ